MSKVVITGGAGYIGSHAVKSFLTQGDGVIVLDNFSRGYRQALENLKQYGKLTFFEVDLRDKGGVEEVFDKIVRSSDEPVSTVLHFAALCLVNESMENPELYFENNVLGTLNLLVAMKKHSVKNIIFSSTCATYGEAVYLPVDENHPQEPTNPYGESKLMAERIIKWFHDLYDFKYVIFRYFNVCGADPGGFIGDSKKPSQLLVQNAVRGAMGIEPFELTCPKVSTKDGTPIRDYVDVSDLVEAHYLAYKYLSEGGTSEIFNLGTGKGFSVKEIVGEVEKILGVQIPQLSGKTRKGEYAKVYAAFDKAKNVLKWYPNTSLRESVINLQNWYKNYPNGFEN